MYGRTGTVTLGLVGSVVPGIIDGWLASNDANNAAVKDPNEAPDWQTQSGIYKGLLLGVGVLAMAVYGPEHYPLVGSALTARELAFRFAQRGHSPPMRAQGYVTAAGSTGFDALGMDAVSEVNGF